MSKRGYIIAVILGVALAVVLAPELVVFALAR